MVVVLKLTLLSRFGVNDVSHSSMLHGRVICTVVVVVILQKVTEALLFQLSRRRAIIVVFWNILGNRRPQYFARLREQTPSF